MHHIIYYKFSVQYFLCLLFVKNYFFTNPLMILMLLSLKSFDSPIMEYFSLFNIQDEKEQLYLIPQKTLINSFRISIQKLSSGHTVIWSFPKAWEMKPELCPSALFSISHVIRGKSLNILVSVFSSFKG